MHGPGGSAPGRVHGLGVSALGGCMDRVSAPGGAWSWGVHGPRGVCLVETPPTATAAGGTHPTGKYSYHK